MRHRRLFGTACVLLVCFQLCEGRDIYQQPKKEQQQQQPASVDPAAAVVPASTPAAQPSRSNNFIGTNAAAGPSITAPANRTGPGMPIPAAGVGLRGMMQHTLMDSVSITVHSRNHAVYKHAVYTDDSNTARDIHSCFWLVTHSS